MRRRPHRHRHPLARLARRTAFVPLALIGGGAVLLGSVAGRFATSEIKHQGPSLAAFEPIAQGARTSDAPAAYEQGRAWALSAFPIGLRNCPAPSASFEAGCRAQMATLIAMPPLPPEPVMTMPAADAGMHPVSYDLPAEASDAAELRRQQLANRDEDGRLLAPEEARPAVGEGQPVQLRAWERMAQPDDHPAAATAVPVGEP